MKITKSSGIYASMPLTYDYRLRGILLSTA
jgi:hypothetical protein